MGSWGPIIQGAGTAIAAGSSIASAMQGKSAAEQAAALQRQALAQSGQFGDSSVALGLGQLDLQRQMAERQIEFANQWLGTTEPFRNQILQGGPLTVGGSGGVPGGVYGTTRAAGLSAPRGQTLDPSGQFVTNGGGPILDPSAGLVANPGAAAPVVAAGPDPPRQNFDGSWEVPGLPGSWGSREAALSATGGSGAAAAPGGGAANGIISIPERTFAPTPFTQTPAERDTLEAQFRNAREATLANSPVRGGALGRQLMELEMGRAGQIVGLESNLARRNQEMGNAAELTNFQALLDSDRFNAADAINVRNMNFNSALADRQMAGQIGFGAAGVALPAMQGASAAYNPSVAGSIYGPALQASGQALQVGGQNLASANQMSGGAGNALGSLAAAGKLMSSKGGSRGGNTGGSGFGKS